MTTKKIVTYVYDYTTSNNSFLKMYKVLKSLGIKKNKFFLKLYDKTLRGVNPHDEKNLTIEQKVRIIREIKRNKWYYLREVIRIPVPGGKIPYELNRGNLALSWCKSMNLNILMMMPRQQGKTIGAISDDTWIYHFGTKNSNLVYGNKELGDAKLNLKRFKDITNALPEFVKEAILRPGMGSNTDKDNETEICSTISNNNIHVVSSATDPVKADKLG